MKVVPAKTTYLEMLSPDAAQPAAIPSPYSADRIAVRRLSAPGVSQYRALYRGVGRQYHWVDRLLMPDVELEAIIQDERVEILVLYVDGEAAGYAELDRRTPGEIELAYFGLFPPFIGRGLGKFLLREAIAIAWRYAPRRLWVHTCDLDHPGALANYLQAGFVVYDERIVQQRIPELPPGV